LEKYDHHKVRRITRVHSDIEKMDRDALEVLDARM
jgi:hypothetical protein